MVRSLLILQGARFHTATNLPFKACHCKQEPIELAPSIELFQKPRWRMICQAGGGSLQLCLLLLFCAAVLCCASMSISPWYKSESTVLKKTMLALSAGAALFTEKLGGRASHQPGTIQICRRCLCLEFSAIGSLQIIEKRVSLYEASCHQLLQIWKTVELWIVCLTT